MVQLTTDWSTSLQYFFHPLLTFSIFAISSRWAFSKNCE